METFWKTIALYNSSTWVYQLIITLTGICLTAYLIKKPCRRSIISMKIFLIALYLWISIVYFYIYCAERSYNNVMAIFWGILAASWLWDLLTGYTPFERNHKYTRLAFPVSDSFHPARHGFPDHHLPCHAMFGCGFHHRNSIDVLPEDKPVHCSPALPLGNDRILEDFLLQDSRRLFAGQCLGSSHLFIFQRIFLMQSA